MRLFAPVALILLLPGIIAAQNNDYKPDPNWKAPAADAARKNPLADNRSAVKKSHELFEAQCSMCHGVEGRGLANAANFHNPDVQQESDGTLFWKITNGNKNKGMPSFKYLSEEQRWQLVTYIRTLRDKRGGKSEE